MATIEGRPTIERESRCPVVRGERFEPMNVEQARDPHPWLAAARATDSVFWMPQYKSWYVTRYQDQLEILRDAETYSSSQAALFAQLPEDLRAVFPEGPPLVLLDEPEHLRLRRLAQVAFSPKLVEARAERLREICNGLIDSFIDDGHCDLVSRLADVLPVLAIVETVGAPLDRADDFVQWASDRGALLSIFSGAAPLAPEQAAEIRTRAVSFTAWLRTLVDERRETPQDDLITALIQASGKDDEPALTTTEVVGLIATILSAGTSTTANFIPICVMQCLRRPEVWRVMADDRGRITDVVEEMLRLYSSVRGIVRRTANDVRVAGVAIPAGEQIFVHLASADRDENVFPDPDAFDLERTGGGRHIAFGRYRHLCLGAPLARLETRIVLECLLDRMPGLRLADGWEERWVPNIVTPGLADLELTWGAQDLPTIGWGRARACRRCADPRARRARQPRRTGRTPVRAGPSTGRRELRRTARRAVAGAGTRE
jgi:cytochrome P450